MRHKNKYPKQKRKKCNSCKSMLLINFEDCHIGETVLGVLAYYASCPNCGKEIYYCDVLTTGITKEGESNGE